LTSGKNGVLVEMDMTFNLSLKAKQEESNPIVKTVTSDNSMANAETEDDELSFIKNKQYTNRIVRKSSKIVIRGS
jgi:small nuclear ribonucleoprotein (snRNP)-like protein